MNILKESNILAFIPAAGYGVRMGERCSCNQKCMLPIWEEQKPILYYIIDNLKRVGVTKFVIAVNHFKEQIKNYFGDGSEMGIEIKYIEGVFSCTYDTLFAAIEQLPEVFLYSHGDMVFESSVYERLVHSYFKEPISTIALMPNTKLPMTHPQLEIDNSYIKSIHFNVSVGTYPYMYLGAAIYNKADFLNNYDGNRDGMVEKMVSQKLNNGEPIGCVIYNESWRHLMNEEDYQLLVNEKCWLSR